MNRDMPEFGYLQDDGLLMTSAKSIASGDGYRIASLPDSPFQSKYPPLWPAYLSLVWRLAPQFPGNLVLTTLACWLVLCAYLWLCALLLSDYDLSKGTRWTILILLACNPYLVLFGVTPFSEVFYSCWVLIALLMLRRERFLMAGVAGLFGNFLL